MGGYDSTVPGWVQILLGALLAYAVLVAGLAVAGRRSDARALAGFVPDCVLLVRGLLRDPRVPGWAKLALGGLALYLASPVDLVPDFIPVAGQLDDAILLALVLRSVMRSTGESVVREHWRGPERSLGVLLRLAGTGRP